MNGINHFLVGCDCNRETLDSIEAAGFEVTELERTTLAEAPAYVSPLIVGAATAGAGSLHGGVRGE